MFCVIQNTHNGIQIFKKDLYIYETLFRICTYICLAIHIFRAKTTLCKYNMNVKCEYGKIENIIKNIYFHFEF